MKIEAIGTNYALSGVASGSNEGVADGRKLFVSFFSSQGSGSHKEAEDAVSRPKKPKSPAKPSVPEFDGKKTIWTPKGWTIPAIVEKYNITVEEFLEHNPAFKSADDNIVGKKIVIPFRKKESWAEYQTAMKKYNAEVKEYKRKMTIYEKSLKSYEIIKQLHAHRAYEIRGLDLDINPATGNVRIKFSGAKTLGDVRTALGIKGGKIREYNPHIERKYKPVRKMGQTWHMENNWNLVKPDAGEIIELPPECIEFMELYK